MEEKKIIISVALAVLLIIGVGFLYLRSPDSFIKGPEAGMVEDEKGGLGAQIYLKAANPAKDEFPEANPFAVDTNPFDTGVNPYADSYKNPFE